MSKGLNPASNSSLRQGRTEYCVPKTVFISRHVDATKFVLRLLGIAD